MKTICLFAEKGGVGKTTLAFHVAAGLADHGRRVLLIDADGQAHATRLSGFAPTPGLYNLLVRNADWRESVAKVAPECYYTGREDGTLALLPGNHETMVIPQAISDYDLLRRRLAELGETFDIAIIDTSPTPSLLNGAILVATDQIILPTELEYFSLQALQTSLNNAKNFANLQAARGLSPVEISGIVPTMYRAGTVEHQQNLALLKQQYGDLIWSELPQRITWPEAAMQRQAVWIYAPKSEASREAWLMVHHVEELLYAAEQA